METKFQMVLLHEIIIWNDGIRTLFRSRFIFMLVSNFDLTKSLGYHQNEAHHEKGPMLRADVTEKSLVFRAARS